MSETPEFEGPLNNTEVSEEANRQMDKLTDNAGLPPVEARKKIPEFAALEEPPGQNEQIKPRSQRKRIPVYGATQREIADNDRKAADIRERAAEESALRSEPFTEEELEGVKIARRWIDEHGSKPEQN